MKIQITNASVCGVWSLEAKSRRSTYVVRKSMGTVDTIPTVKAALKKNDTVLSMNPKKSTVSATF